MRQGWMYMLNCNSFRFTNTASEQTECIRISKGNSDLIHASVSSGCSCQSKWEICIMSGNSYFDVRGQCSSIFTMETEEFSLKNLTQFREALFGCKRIKQSDCSQYHKPHQCQPWEAGKRTHNDDDDNDDWEHATLGLAVLVTAYRTSSDVSPSLTT